MNEDKNFREMDTSLSLRGAIVTKQSQRMPCHLDCFTSFAMTREFM